MYVYTEYKYSVLHRVYIVLYTVCRFRVHIACIQSQSASSERRVRVDFVQTAYRWKEYVV